MLVRTVCRTTVGLSAASAAVPNGQDDDRRGSGEGPLGRFAGVIFWPGSSGHADCVDRRCATEGRRIRLRRQQPPTPTRRPHQRSVDLDGDPERVDRQAQHGETVQVERRAAARRPWSAPGRSVRRRRSRPERPSPAARRPEPPTPDRPAAGTPGAAGPRWRAAAARALCESENGERGAASGERGVRERNRVGKQPARRGRGRFDLRDERDGRDAGVRVDPYSVEPVVVHSTRRRILRTGSPPRCPRGPPCRP